MRIAAAACGVLLLTCGLARAQAPGLVKTPEELRDLLAYLLIDQTKPQP